MEQTRSPCRTTLLLVLTISLYHLNVFVLAEEAVLLKRDQNSPSQWMWLTRFEFGAWSGWSQNGHTGSYTVCDLSETATNHTNSWLVSEFIDLQGANEVHINLNFTSRQCPNGLPYCKQSFNVYEYKTDAPVHGGVTRSQVDAGNFTFVGNINATDPWLPGNAPQINEANLTFAANGKGVYIGFQDTGACISLTSVTVVSKFCPDMVNHGVVFNKTAAPSANQYNITVNGSCSHGASPYPSDTDLALVCLSTGEWATNERVTCQCTAGYELLGDTCTECQAGYFKEAIGNGQCTACPANSESSLGHDSCPCRSGFYRAPQDDVNGSCSAPPSEPRDINVTVVTDSVVMVTWSSPVIHGGRSDVRYDLTCSACSNAGDCSNNCLLAQFWPSKVDIDSPQVTISNLDSMLLYNISVVSKNGVSAQAGPSSLLSSSKAFSFPQLTSNSPTTSITSVTSAGTTPSYNSPSEKVAEAQSTESSKVATAIGVSVAVTFVVCFILAVVFVALLVKFWKKKHMSTNEDDRGSNLSSQTQLTDVSRSGTPMRQLRSSSTSTLVNNDHISLTERKIDERDQNGAIPAINVENNAEKYRPPSADSIRSLYSSKKGHMLVTGWSSPRAITPILLPRRQSDKNLLSSPGLGGNVAPNPTDASEESGFEFSRPERSPSINSWFPAEEIQYNV